MDWVLVSFDARNLKLTAIYAIRSRRLIDEATIKEAGHKINSLVPESSKYYTMGPENGN